MPLTSVVGLVVGVIFIIFFIFLGILLLVIYQCKIVSAEGIRAKFRSLNAQRRGAQRFHNEETTNQEVPYQNGNERVAFDNIAATRNGDHAQDAIASPAGVAITVPGDTSLDVTLKATDYSTA